MRYMRPIGLFLVVLHAGAVAAFFDVSWPAAAVACLLYWVAGGLGIGLGYHRLLTHRAYAVPKVVAYGLAVCGTLALQGGPVWWVATHRAHHAHTDRAGDPHSPNDGAWWSHMGWVLRGFSFRHDCASVARYAPDLSRDRFLVLLTRWHLLPPLAVAAALYAIGGRSWVLWGSCLCLTVMLHSTWLVNSATHMWGRRRFETRDDSRNSWWVALLTFGEGWHNNHHARPSDARHGLAWYELDANWWCIRTLERVGIATDVKVTVSLKNGPN